MPLKVSSGKSEGYLGDGVYVDDVEIIGINNLSGQTSQFQQYASDLCVEVSVKILKNDWTKTFNIAGNFSRDLSTKEVTDWGGAFKVRDFFLACRLKEMLEENLSKLENGEISDEMKEAVVGKKIMILSYRNKKGKTSTWNQVNSERTPQAFKDYFMKEWIKSKKNPKGPWPSNYEPDSTESNNNDDLNFGTNTEAVNVSGDIASF